MQMHRSTNPNIVLPNPQIRMDFRSFQIGPFIWGKVYLKQTTGQFYIHPLRIFGKMLNAHNLCSLTVE